MLIPPAVTGLLLTVKSKRFRWDGPPAPAAVLPAVQRCDATEAARGDSAGSKKNKRYLWVIRDYFLVTGSGFSWRHRCVTPFCSITAGNGRCQVTGIVRQRRKRGSARQYGV